MNTQAQTVTYPKQQPSQAMSIMEDEQVKNTLIGLTTADTLANISAIVMLLKEVDMSNGINESSEHGLFTIYTLIRNSLEYEIEKMKTPEA